ncbi:MAG: alpha-ketoacid dehydrogenase subunit beta [Atopostipes sp.]|nr:alpha-ketoacid dehydrogenase subunit beta [Atopostipes sp.]
MAKITFAEAITDGLRVALDKYDNTMVFGQDVGPNGGVFRITEGLQDEFGTDKVFDTPLAESAILGMTLGLGHEGFRPLPELQFSGFSMEAISPLMGQISRYRYRYGGTRNQPITIRAPFGAGVGTPELHSDSMEGLFAGIPGLRVVVPSNAYDAKGLLLSSIESNDPVIFLEHLKLYRSVRGEVPEEHYTVPLDKAVVTREGEDLTIVSSGYMVHESLKAAETLEEAGISAEVIDLRTISPIDMETIEESVKKTHRILVVQEAQRQTGVAGSLMSEIGERNFMELDAPVARVTAPDSVYPFVQIEDEWTPDASDIVDKATEIVEF